ncbi:MAG: carboxyl transferase domain-containing protein [Chloroflexota bacterium]
MTQPKLLIANRGEIAIRIARAAAELGIPTVGIYAADDANNLHIHKVDEAVPLAGTGVAAYLDGQQIIEIAQQTGCTLLHPGYGFLSENGRFAQLCNSHNITFIGPRPNILDICGNKAATRQLAANLSIPIIPGTQRATTLAEAEAFLAQHPDGIMLKAIAGGGGRGMRVVVSQEELVTAWERCQSEAQQAFGNGDLYVEKWLPQVRHIEVQIVGDCSSNRDGSGDVAHLGERECSIQRRHQKLIEIAPAPGLSERLRERLCETAVSLAQHLNYNSLGTIEFLVEGTTPDAPFYFIEANPRLQVEHTITEEIYGIDLVQAQIQIALGQSLADLGLTQEQIPAPSGQAMQLRLNMETLDSSGNALLSSGTLTRFDLPSGIGLRTDGFGYNGYANNPSYDSLLVKLICYVRSTSFSTLVTKAYRALCETNINGIATNLSFLQAILQYPNFSPNHLNTRFIPQHLSDLTTTRSHKQLTAPNIPTPNTPISNNQSPISTPLGTNPIHATMPGSLISLDTGEGEFVHSGQTIAVIEAMKMESVITAPFSGIVVQILAAVGDVVGTERPLCFIEPVERDEAERDGETAVSLDHIRPDLAELFTRRQFLLDENRINEVTKRHKRGQRTARENIADLCDPDSFVEYGSAIVAAQRRRRSLDDLIKRTPADGLITGYGSVNGDKFGEETARCLVMAYDYMVLAGTQGALNHKKMDRMLKLAGRWKRPLILFAEGGGGRPGDVDYPAAATLDVMTFTLYAKLSGQIPLISIVSGYCFAGNAALAGCADVIIATENSSLGMGGPAMIEGGGLGIFHPKEVGPSDVQAQNGVIDILVKDEAEAVAAAKKYLSYFQGTATDWSCADQRELRRLIPENRRRIYDIHQVIHTLADTDSVLELRASFGIGIVTAFARIEGRPIGIIANNPKHLGGAIDSDGADKAARFMQLCDAFSIPILALVDTPGIMVGPDAEKSGTVRHASRLFITGASLSVPYFAIVLRKGYGLGAQAMCAGSFHVPFFTVAWPTGEFGPMGLEGAVRLGFRKELEKIEDPDERQAVYEKMVAQAYEQGKGLNAAAYMEIDEVIDPIESRRWLLSGLTTAQNDTAQPSHPRSMIDPW